MGKVYTKCEYLLDSEYGGGNASVAAVSILEYTRGEHDDVFVLQSDNKVLAYEFLDEDDYDEHDYEVIGTAESVSEFLTLVNAHR